MKNITFILMVGLLIFSSSIKAQNTTSLDNLLDRLSENHLGSVTDVFTNEEIEVLKIYFYNKNTIDEKSSLLPDIRIATTQAVQVVIAANINPVDLESIEELLPSPLENFEGAGFTIQTSSHLAFIIDNANLVWMRNLLTGEYTPLGNLLNVPKNHSITGLERLTGPQGTLYGISTNGKGSSALLQIDTITWEATIIGYPNLILPINLGRDADDNLYTVDIDNDKFYRLNLSTGDVTEIGDIGFDANFGQGMTYDPDTDKLLLTAFNNDLFDSELREVNINTGYSTSLGTIVPGTLMQFGWGSMYDRDILGSEDNFLNDFNFYPNPAKDFITLNSSTIIDIVEIYSLLGQKLITNKIESTNSVLNISHLPTGNYILKVISIKETGTYKLVKH